MTVAAQVDSFPVDVDATEALSGPALVVPVSQPCSSPDVEASVTAHLPLLGYLVRGAASKLPGQVNRYDLVSAGMLALVLAARSYDACRGVPFDD